jgi:hypothetical protein
MILVVLLSKLISYWFRDLCSSEGEPFHWDIFVRVDPCGGRDDLNHPLAFPKSYHHCIMSSRRREVHLEARRILGISS